MYVQSRERANVESWVGAVKRLKYKDFQLVVRPGPLQSEKEEEMVVHGAGNPGPRSRAKSSEHSGRQKDLAAKVGVEEVDSVKDFGGLMKDHGIWRWWRRGMGYKSVD